MTEAKDTDGTPLAQLGQRIADAETLRELAPADDIAGDTLCEIADRLERSTGSLPPAPRDGLVGSDEAVETALSAVDWSLIGEPNGTTMASAREAAAHVAVTVAARVRAEAVAEHRADLQHRIEVSTRYENDRRVALAERDEYHRHWQEAEKRTAKAVAEAVAEERQRIVGEFAKAAQVAHKGDGETDAQRLFEVAKRVEGGYSVGGSSTTETVTRLLRFVAGFISAAGSVPVATPTPTARDERPHSRACGWRRHEHGSACAVDCPTCSAGATPAEPLTTVPVLLAEVDRLTAEVARYRAAIEAAVRTLDRIAAEPPRSERLRATSLGLAAALGDGE